ncbi:DNA methyltransferase [Pseudoalteromonas distincta]|uniref:DNA methyltransferase n=1 Tax=Pseudoalteromonas distincta TaxID=77608 RepID=UPI00241C219F|nr:site-specific DNA-methyltransferase [Pseudoalteromonas distincta]|tara:strand:+ start:31627 stop:33492 length:1866 start_codon:yes stop_codon:yes gene_type:complete
MTILNQLLEALSTDERLVIGGKLAKNKIVELALKLDPALLKILLANDQLKSHFFTDIEGMLVFDKVAFQRFVNNKSFLPDSFTQFKNKIGLSVDSHYLADSNDVVLSWPYKDCVLEGGQTEDEQKRSEIFWNETLAPEQLDTLLAPKVLTGFTKFDKDGFNNEFELKNDENLVIKGNNLLALKSIESKYLNSIEMIYLDPPYNTQSDSFGYNDTFNHSSWLTFMKPRLEVAKRLLTETGSLWVSIDDNEAHYLKVLLDEVFGRSCFVASNVWQKRYSRENREAIGDVHEYIFVYSKNPLLFKEKRNLVPINEKQAKVYRNPNNDPKGRWRPIPMTAQAGHATPEQFYEVTSPSGKVFTPPDGRCWGIAKATYERLNAEGRIYFGKNGDAQPNTIRYLSEVEGVTPWTWWPSEEVGHTDEAKKEMHSLFGKLDTFESPKPERLLERIIHIATSQDDIILDFFAGSGTTAAVALKLKRKFITIEQMDYIDKFTIKRLRSVIDGEQGGISREVNWQGGGSFVYCELAELASKYSDRIEQAENSNELIALWNDLKESSNLSYKIDPKEFDKNIQSFNELSYEDQQRFLIEAIDKNQLYVNYSEIDDETNGISDQDKKFNYNFYGA